MFLIHDIYINQQVTKCGARVLFFTSALYVLFMFVHKETEKMAIT